jgi:LysM repeat protein
MSITNLTPTQLRQAADLQEQIAKLNQQLAVLAGGGKTAAPTKAAPVKAAKPARKKISAAGIARIKAAQKARWAAIRAAKGKPGAKATAVPSAQPVKKGRKKMSAEAKARIATAARARWAKVRAEKAAKK